MGRRDIPGMQIAKRLLAAMNCSLAKNHAKHSDNCSSIDENVSTMVDATARLKQPAPIAFTQMWIIVAQERRIDVGEALGG